MNFSHLSHSSHVQTRKLCSSKYSKGKNMFSSFLIEEAKPRLAAAAAPPAARYHDCVVFHISVERTEHALNNILYRESPLHRSYRKAKGKFKCLKDLPSKCLGGWQPGNRTKHEVCVTAPVRTDLGSSGMRRREETDAERDAMGKHRQSPREPRGERWSNRMNCTEHTVLLWVSG